jgi:hypothetical protein
MNPKPALAQPTATSVRVGSLQIPIDTREASLESVNPIEHPADVAGCQRIFVVALRLQRLFFVHPRGRELVGRLGSLPCNTNHHAVCRWTLQQMPALAWREVTDQEWRSVIEAFASEMRPLLQPSTAKG